MSTLRAVNLAKQYKSRSIFSDVSLHVETGEIIGLLGPNGAGKTTCFYSIVGLIQPDAGEVSLNDQAITQLPMHARAQLGIGYLPQEASVFRKLSVADNIMAALELRVDLDRSARETTLDQLLSEFQISHLRETMGISLSGGERRRVEIARSLATDPAFILLDEPFAGVDPISVADIQNIIKHLRERGLGVLITDHNVRETLRICDRAYILSEGAVLCEGRSDEILENQKVKEVYLGKDFVL
ncbi:MAG: LPS export ABC transporter ATP-binding protein [Pseudomonadota bacterium]